MRNLNLTETNSQTESLNEQLTCRSQSSTISNDCNLFLFNSSSSSNSNVTASSGLKLVLKRQAGNTYEVAANSSFSSNCSVSSGSTRRPKREAARRVKFIFSDNENELELLPPSRKRTKTISTHQSRQINNIVNKKKLKQEKNNFDATLSDQDSFDENQIEEKFSKYIQNCTNLTMQTSTLSSISNTQAKFKQDTKQSLSYNDEDNNNINNRNNVVSFTRDEIFRTDILTKVEIVKNKPDVVINHSIPFPIALVEDKTNIVCTKAILFIHLFQTFSSQCIGCPLCKTFLNISEFSKHIHANEEEEEDDYESKNTGCKSNKKKSYKILPYRLNNSDELSESDLRTWKLFGQRYSMFKQIRACNAEKKNKKESIQTTLPPPLLLLPSSEKDEQQQPTPEFSNWDYVSQNKKVFLLSQTLLDADPVVYLNKSGTRLSDNEEELENVTAAAIDKKKKQEIEKKNYFLDVNNNNFNKTTNKQDEENDLVLSEEEEDDQFENIIEKTKNKNKLVLFKNTESTMQQRPSLLERYFNFYDNLSKEILVYICDNQFTIIPDSFILYVNSKRELNFKQLRLAQSSYYQTLWLSLSLDLECGSFKKRE